MKYDVAIITYDCYIESLWIQLNWNYCIIYLWRRRQQCNRDWSFLQYSNDVNFPTVWHSIGWIWYMRIFP